MALDFQSPLPFYRKLLLENKILVFFGALLIVLGAVVLVSIHWSVMRLAAEVPLEPGAAAEFAWRTAALVAVLAAAPLALLFLIARAAVRKAVQPLKELTRVADEISTGNLEPRIDFGVHVNCWEIKNCQRTDCKAYMNFGAQCWYVDGTPCEGYEPRFPQKLAGCRTCEVYQAHRGDEIIQLADSFKHMAGVIKEAGRDLVKSDEFQARLIRNSFNGIVATDENDEVTIFNRVAEELTGYDRKEILGTGRWRGIFETGIEKHMDMPLSFERERRVRGMAPKESAARHKDGSTVAVRLSGITLFDHGRHVGKVFFFEDMREIERLRSDLIAKERLAAAGQAAAGISHSIKNILDGFRGGAYVFKQGKRRGDADKMDRGWEMIERNVEIISNLVKDLLNFAKDRPPQYEACDPRALLADVTAAVGLNGTERIVVNVAVDEPGRTVDLDPHAFHQCLANLARNAVEAMGPEAEGTVSLSVTFEGDRAVFTVADDGEGMTPALVAKVREGMYSTKGSKGTGLGLMVVRKIVTEHGGELTIESEPGKGSAFRIAVPARRPHADDEGNAPAQVSPA